MYKLPATEVEPVRFRREGARRVFRESGTATAAQIIGPIKPGDDICGITNGQFSLIDVVEHVLNQTGPADVAIATRTDGQRPYFSDGVAKYFHLLGYDSLVKHEAWMDEPIELTPQDGIVNEILMKYYTLLQIFFGASP